MTIVASIAAFFVARRALIDLPELECVAWILAVLGAIVVSAMYGHLTVLVVP